VQRGQKEDEFQGAEEWDDWPCGRVLLTWPIAAHHYLSHQVRPAGRMHEIGHRTHSAVDETAVNAGQ
jgi:hypothetical protein